MSSHDWNRRLSGIRHFSRFTVILALLCLVMTVSSCMPSGTVTFPEETTTTTSATTAVPSETSGIAMPDDGILVATRYPEDAIRYLGMFFYSRLTGVFPPDSETRIGLDVNLAELDQFRGVFPMDVLRIPSGEEGADHLRSLIASGVIPDIYTTDSAPSAAAEGIAADLTKTVSEDMRFSPGSVQPSVMEGVKWNGRVYGVPDYLTVPILYAYRQVAEQYALELPFETGWDAERFTTELRTIQATAAMDEGLPEDRALASSADLLAYLPSGLDPSVGWSAWNGKRFSFEGDAFLSSVDWIRTLADEGLTADRVLTQTNAAGAYSPYSGQSVLTATESGKLAGIRAEGRDVVLARIPYFENERTAIHVHAFCVHPQSSGQKLIVDFAVFLGMDPDARLLLSRFHSEEGELPALAEEDIWSALLERQASASFFLPYQDLLPDAYPDGFNIPAASETELLNQYTDIVRSFLEDDGTPGQMIQSLTDATR